MSTLGTTFRNAPRPGLFYLCLQYFCSILLWHMFEQSQRKCISNFVCVVLGVMSSIHESNYNYDSWKPEKLTGKDFQILATANEILAHCL